MNNSNALPDSTSRRVTLKLKGGALKAPQEDTTRVIPQAQKTSKQKPGANWSDEYKQRMQSDMDGLRQR
jgi:hypothetical protein